MPTSAHQIFDEFPRAVVGIGPCNNIGAHTEKFTILTIFLSSSVI